VVEALSSCKRDDAEGVEK